MEKRRGLLSQPGFGFIGLLELLLVVLMVAVFFYVLPTIGRRTQSIGLVGKDTRKEMAQAGINTATPETTANSVNAKLKGVQAQLAERRNQALETN